MAKTITNKKRIGEVLARGIEKIYPSSDALEKILLSREKLKIYHGVDPTGPHLHLGHLTNLLALKRLQELGHEIILLIGDFTAKIGDPTDKTSARQPLTEKNIKNNLKTFKKQVGRILPLSGSNAIKFEFNSKWLSKMRLEDFIKLTRYSTVQQMIQRDMFQKRLKSNKPIGLNEFLYPLMQGYDSVAMDVDLEIGGNDQTFNMLIGRDLIKIYKNKEKFVITTKLLVNSKTGKKLMNKSEGGMINLDDSPKEMYGKIMALDDIAIIPVAEFSSEMPMEKVNELKRLAKTNPRNAKLEVAASVVETVYSKKEAEQAKENFIKVFTKKENPKNIKKIKIKSKNIKLIDLLVKTSFTGSKNEAKRLIHQGGVRINGVKKTDPHETIKLLKETLIQVGPRRFVKVSGS